MACVVHTSDMCHTCVIQMSYKWHTCFIKLTYTSHACLILLTYTYQTRVIDLRYNCIPTTVSKYDTVPDMAYVCKQMSSRPSCMWRKKAMYVLNMCHVYICPVSHMCHTCNVYVIWVSYNCHACVTHVRVCVRGVSCC